MSFSDEKFGTLFPTRDGVATGAASERKMLDAIGGADSFRTRIQNNADGSTTMLRTKNGQPQFSTTAPSIIVPETAVIEQLCAVKVPAYSSDYTLAFVDVAYVSMDKDGGSQVTYPRDVYYATRAFASKWYGAGVQAGKTVIANTARDGSRWQGLGPLSPDSRLGNPPVPAVWAGTLIPYDTGVGSIYRSATGGESTRWGTAIAKPPGSPLRWFAWDQSATRPHVFPYSLFTDGYALAYGVMSAIRKKPVAHIDTAFYQWNAGASDLCYIQCLPDTVSTTGIPHVESVFGQLVNVSQGSAVDILYEAVPAKGFAVEPAYTPISMQTFSNSQWYIPLVVNGEGTRALCLNNAFYRRNSNDYTSNAIAALDINLLTKRVKVFEADSYYLNNIGNTTPQKYCDLLDFGFIDSDAGQEAAILCTHYALDGGQTMLLQRGIFLGQKSLVVLSAPSALVEIECAYSDIAADLFIVAIKRLTQPRAADTPQEVHVAFIVIYKRAAVKTFYVNQNVLGELYTQQKYENTIVETNSTDGLFTVAPNMSLPFTGAVVPLHSHYVFDGLGGYTWEGPFGGRRSTYTASASVDKAQQRIAASIVLSGPNVNDTNGSSRAPRRDGTVRADYGQQDDICLGPVTINAIIDIPTGTATTFGSTEHYYNRLHYQEV